MIQCVAATQDVCGEGAVWHAAQAAVYWTDINRALIHRMYAPTGEVSTWRFDQPVVALSLTNDSDRLVVVLGGRILLWDPRDDKRDQVLFRLPEWPATRCNDARVDPVGRLWFGTMQNNVAEDGTTREVSESLGQLLSLDADGQIVKWDDGFGISNTLAWTPAGDTFLFGDTLQNVIYRYAYEASSGAVSTRQIFTSGFARGLPDGSAMDTQGYLWNCRYGGGCVVRFAPSGAVDKIIEMPVRNPTTCAFGGDDLRTLYITSAGDRDDLGEDAGGLFAMSVHVSGLPQPVFRLKA